MQSGYNDIDMEINGVCVLKTQVAASFAAEGGGMGELKQWNELYGEGGSRKKEQLTYFL